MACDFGGFAKISEILRSLESHSRAPRERSRFPSQEIGPHRRRPGGERKHALPRGFGEAMLGLMPMIGPQNKIIERHPGGGRGQQIIQREQRRKGQRPSSLRRFMPSNASHRMDAAPNSPADIQSTTSISSKAEAGDGRPAPRSWTRRAVKNGQSGGAITKPVIVMASARLCTTPSSATSRRGSRVRVMRVCIQPLYICSWQSAVVQWRAFCVGKTRGYYSRTFGPVR
jgi:hypothetical protein